MYPGSGALLRTVRRFGRSESPPLQRRRRKPRVQIGKHTDRTLVLGLRETRLTVTTSPAMSAASRAIPSSDACVQALIVEEGRSAPRIAGQRMGPASHGVWAKENPYRGRGRGCASDLPSRRGMNSGAGCWGREQSLAQVVLLIVTRRSARSVTLRRVYRDR